MSTVTDKFTSFDKFFFDNKKSSKYSIKCNFYARHTFCTIDHLILYGIFASFKACVRYFLSNFYFSPNKSPSKTMKNVFHFI